MTDRASSSRSSKPSPGRGDPGNLPVENRASSGQGDQATVISHRPPLAAPQFSDLACRILRGEILPGDCLEHFELVQYAGGGGMGRVFRAVDTRLQRTVAVKILPPEQASDEETLLRFQNEAQSAARLDHDNIARVYHVGQDQGLHYIVFEFVEGVNIRALVEQQGPLPLGEAVGYTLQVAEALAHADARSVVHRDIKPSNLLITPEGQIKLIDMGLARLKRASASAADLTASGVTLGTFDYIAPEQARDPRSADVRSDIYSLGCTFFYMLAGRPPFPEGTVLQKLLQHQGDQPPDVRQFRPDLPDEAAGVLRKMLAKDPRHRYRDSAELVDELLSLAYQIGLQPASRVGRAMVPPRKKPMAVFRRHLPWMASVAALVGIVLMLDFLPRHADPTPPPWTQLPPLAHGDKPEAPPPEPGKQATQPPGAGQSKPSQETSHTASQVQGGPGGNAAANHPPSEPKVSSPGEPEAVDRALPKKDDTGSLQADPLESRLTLADEASPSLSPVSGAEADSGGLSGAAGPAAEPSGGWPPPGPASSRSGLLVVSDHPQKENEFLTLQAACRAAVSGDVIELRYNGRREEQPITLVNLRLTIRAGKDYQPVVVFRPEQVDPVKYPRSMFTVTAGRLTLVNLALELQVPRRVPAESWSLFETRGSQTVRLDRCALSICNASDQLAAYHADVAFFRSKSVPDADAAAGEQSLAAAPPATVDLVDCIARGEAVFLCAADLQPVHLIWENGLLVTTEELLWAVGNKGVPRPGETLQVELRYLTAVVHGGLCRMTQTVAAPHQLDAQIYCGDSIVMGAAGAPLIEQEGGNSLEDLRQQISWNGDRDFYENVDVFWSIRNFDQEALCKPMSFLDWQLYWGPEEESLPLVHSVLWKKLPDAARPLHTHVPADYALADSTPTRPNPARDAGLQAERLPRQPPPLATGEPQPPLPDKEQPPRPRVVPE